MKRLVIAFFVLINCLAINAAVVDWKYKITGVSGSAKDNIYAGYTVYLVDAVKWDAAIIAGIQTATFSDTTIVMDATTFNVGAGLKNNVTYTTLNTENAAAERAAVIDDLGEGATRDFYYVVVNANKNPNEWQNVASATLTGRASTGEVDTTGGKSSTMAAFTSGTWTPVGAGPTPVPEPTTGLLVLAGLAGLTLRRRRA